MGGQGEGLRSATALNRLIKVIACTCDTFSVYKPLSALCIASRCEPHISQVRACHCSFVSLDRSRKPRAPPELRRAWPLMVSEDYVHTTSDSRCHPSRR